MTAKYLIAGMTCMNCKASVEQKLAAVDGVAEVTVNFKSSEVEITMPKPIPFETLQKVLPEKYTLSEQHTHLHHEVTELKQQQKNSKLIQLKPLFLIFFYLIATSNLIHYKNWNSAEVMLDFMGLFFIVFSFFKFLDLKGFTHSFSMYDPIATKSRFYAWIYPFIETALGIAFLMRFQLKIVLFITLFILGITTIGVIKTLVDKKKIRCACLGTALNLPMTEATLIENSIMIVMAMSMVLM